ncbi:hypothetical protein LZL87_006007 [Fusarium oxysporum]|nr:hypothetical protein LZL87_006007 [Fusarium oxysporum]
MHFHWIITSWAFIAGVSVSATFEGHTCHEHRALSGEYVDGPVTMGADPLTHFDSPMVKVFNSSASENWSFDAASNDGKASIVLYLTRGTVATVVGAQRGLISVSWANGTRYMKNVFVGISTLPKCPKTMSGLRTSKAGDISWGFTASNDFKQSVVTIKSPTINGTFKLKSRGPPIYPEGLVYPDPRASVLFAPEMYWQEQFPVADAEVQLNIRGTPFILTGIGDWGKNWNSRTWTVISRN